MKTFATRDTLIFPIPTGYTIYDGFKRLGWKSFYIPTPSEGGKRLIDYDYEGHIDILFDCPNLLSNTSQYNHVEDLKLFKKEYPNCKIFVSGYLPDDRFKAYEGIVDYFFNTTVSHNKAKEYFSNLGLKYISIPAASVVDPVETNETYKYDVSFIGTIDSGERLVNTWYPEIIKPNLKTYLAGFNGKPRVEFNDMLSISKQTKINLNPHYIYQIYEDPNNVNSYIEFNSRVFNLATLGCFQLSNHTAFKKVFGETCPVFDQYNFKDMFEFYLKNDDEREKVVKNMQKIALEKYTSKVFAEKISKSDFNFI